MLTLNPKQRQRVAAVRAEARLVVRAMKDIWSHPRAYELIRAKLHGREANALSERELLEIIADALNEVQRS